MKKALRITAVIVAIGTLAFWAATGANRGWTKTSEAVKSLDPVTGIEGIEYRKHFVPGVDILALGVVVGLAIAAASFLFRKQQTNPSQTR